MLKKTCLAALATALLATTAIADAKSECKLQGDLIGAIQQARLAGVRKAQVPQTVADALPDLSPAVLGTVPQLAEYIYGLNRRDVKQVDMGAATQAQCLENWDRIRKMRNNITK